MNYIEVMGSLNPAQAKAASTLEGAIMVIAGAGTGKTQTLSARAATMLRSEQMISAQNVLCLTFTDAASYAMRKRLIDMVGTEAYKFNIYTFHAWCNEIIQDNLYLFGINDLEPASELEINDIIKKIIDEIPEGNPLYRVKGDKYYEVTRLKNLFSYMKRENVEYEVISVRVKEYLESLPTRDEYIYKKSGKDYKAGDIKLKLIAEEKSKMDALLAGANLLCRYDELMQQEKRYDFDDMLQWVIGQWQSNENFLRSYQERYQYIMVDEFQDTNGAQMKLLELLCSYWEDPNLFVVGDDDQCHPAGTKILTTKGYVNIEDLDPESDRLLTFSKKDCRIYGSQKGGFKFEISERFSNSDKMFEFSCDDHKVKSTFDHLFFARWRKDIRKLKDLYVIYLMQKGENYRIGWCQLFNADGAFHLGVRARIEHADSAWILQLSHSKATASVMESYFSVKFGIPTMMFMSNAGRSSLYTQQVIDAYFNMFPPNEKLANANAILNHCGRNIRYPFWENGKNSHYGASVFLVRACNIISDMMELPVYDPETTSRYNYELVFKVNIPNGGQKVYSLNVEKHHSYVANDIIVHNCIYEFGGARLSNMKRLLEKFKAQMIFLNENYRSDQTILDIAEGVIQNNIQRLLPTKNLVSRIVSNPVTYLCEASNIINEEAFVYSQVSELIRAGVSPGEIGILYRKHKIGENVIRMLKNAGVPVNVKRSINILTEPIIIHLMGIIRYISGYTKSSADEIGARLFEILHYPFLNNDIRELHNLHLQGKLLEHPKIEVINKLTEDYYNLPLIKFIEKLTYELIMPWVVKHEDRIKLNLLLGTFFDFVKTETFKRPWMTGDDLIKNLDEMVGENIRINVMDVNTDEEGVTCSTIHGAKGLEWKHVFLMGCMRSEWESSRAGATSYKLPDTLTMGGEEDSLESNRRLFYVAVTRAKTNLIISYSRKDNFNKDLEPSQFVIETGLSPVQMDSIDISPVIEQTLAPEKKLPRADKQFIENSIPDTYTISISAVNKYLECPVQFYYENVLRAPFVASEPLVYGNSIHEANMKLYMKAREGGMSKDEFLNLFKEAMMKYAGQIKNEYLIKRIDLGIKELVNFYDNYYPQSNKITLVEHKVKVVLEGIPFLYIFDKMEFENIYVVAVDYKTGKKSGVIQSLKPGGHYWRQMVAPKLVLDAMHSKEWKFKGSRIDLFDEGFHSFPVEVSPEDEKLVMNDIKTAYDGITHHLFDVGCGVCKWCQMESGINHK